MVDGAKLDLLVEEMMEWMSRPVTKSYDREHIPIGYFNGALPFSDEWIELTDSGKRQVCMHDQFDALRRPLDVSFIRRNKVGNIARGVAPCEWVLRRVRVIDPNKYKPILRGVTRAGGTLVESACASIHADKRMYCGREFLERRAGGWWHLCHRSSVDYSMYSKQDRLEEHLDVMCVAAGVQLNLEWSWIVSLGWQGHPSVSFETDPVGARDVFRLRDIPEGASRRTALLHWVKQHWRQKRTGEEYKVFVREHMRGTTRFSWNGLECSITPGEYDLEREQKAIQSRQESGQ